MRMQKRDSEGPTLVGQQALARELGVTDRRVRQMVEGHILPESRDGLYDLEFCLDRYGLYREGTDRDWDRFFDQCEDLARESTDLLRAALKPDGTLEMVRAASTAIQVSYRDMRFMTAVRSKSDSERKLFFGVWDREETEAMSLLLSRTCTLMGEQDGRSGREVMEGLRREVREAENA